MSRSERSRLALTLISVGGVLLFLGAVNAYLGHAKSAEYVEMILLLESSSDTMRSGDPAMSGDPAPHRTERRLESAVRKLGFYGTVRRGGGWLAAAGVVLVLAGLVTALKDLRRREQTPRPPGTVEPA